MSSVSGPQVMDSKAPYEMGHLLNPSHLGMPVCDDMEWNTPVAVGIVRSDSQVSHVPSEFWKMPRVSRSSRTTPTLQGRKSSSNSSLFSKMKTAVKKRSAWHL